MLYFPFVELPFCLFLNECITSSRSNALRASEVSSNVSAETSGGLRTWLMVSLTDALLYLEIERERDTFPTCKLNRLDAGGRSIHQRLHAGAKAARKLEEDEQREAMREQMQNLKVGGSQMCCIILYH